MVEHGVWVDLPEGLSITKREKFEKTKKMPHNNLTSHNPGCMKAGYAFTCACGYKFSGSEKAERMAYRLHSTKCEHAQRVRQAGGLERGKGRVGTKGQTYTDVMNAPKTVFEQLPLYTGNQK